MTLKELVVLLKLNTQAYKAGMQEASSMTDNFKGDITNKLNVGGVFSNLFQKALMSFVGLITASVVEATRFRESIIRGWWDAADGAKLAGAEYEKFNQTAIDIGLNSTYSANAIAVAMKVITSNAMDASQAMEQVGWAQKLASATGEDLSASADAVSRSMMIFQKQELTSAEASNYLAVLVHKGAMNLGEMGMAFRTLFPMAAAIGWSMKDLTSVLGVLSTKGVQGFRAIMALSRIMDSALDPTKGLGKELANVGVQVMDTSGKVKPLIEIVSQFKNLGWTTQDVYKKFGTTMGTVFAALIEAGPAAFQEFSSSLETAATGSKTYVDELDKQYRETLPGALKEFRAASDTILTEIGKMFEGALVPIIKTSTELLKSVGKKEEPSPFFVTGLPYTAPIMMPGAMERYKKETKTPEVIIRNKLLTGSSMTRAITTPTAPITKTITPTPAEIDIYAELNKAQARSSEVKDSLNKQLEAQASLSTEIINFANQQTAITEKTANDMKKSTNKPQAGRTAFD